MLSLQATGRTGQGAACRLADTPRSSFNEDKTRIAHLAEGFDFLGFNVRRYQTGKLLIKPSKVAIRRLRERLAAEMCALRGSNAEKVLVRLVPIVRGWVSYYRGVVSSKIFKSLDDYMWKLTYKWAKYIHPNKPKRWIVNRYFGKFNKFRNDRWVFGNRDSGAYLPKFSWTRARSPVGGPQRQPPAPDLRNPLGGLRLDLAFCDRIVPKNS